MTVREARIHMRIEEDFLKDAKNMQKKKRCSTFSEYIRSLIRQDIINERESK